MGNIYPTLDDDLFPIEEDVHSTTASSTSEREGEC